MKTSNKLLIVFFIALPTTLFAYNWLQREQYIIGKLIPELDHSSGDFNDSTDYVTKQLPPCKYLVINGLVSSGNLSEGNYSTFWSNDRNVFIHGDHTGPQQAFVNKNYGSLFTTRLVKDTLYISFYREKHITNISSNSQVLLGLYLNSDVEYIKAGYSNYIVSGSFNLKRMGISGTINSLSNTEFNIKNLQTDELTLTATGATFNIGNLRVNDLNILAKSGAHVSVNNAKGVSTASYTALDSTEIGFYNCHVATYKPVHIDSTAKMNITIKGDAIQKYLTQKH